jgi:hypothetical protein
MKKWLVGFLGLVLALMLVGITAEGAQKNLSAQKDESVRKGETRATLDPNMFNDPQVREAYKIAKEIPWVLDSIYCYCMCEESPAFKHKSLLSCYVDKHASV